MFVYSVFVNGKLASNYYSTGRYSNPVNAIGRAEATKFGDPSATVTIEITIK